MFEVRLKNFEREVTLVKYENIQGAEYFHDHENSQELAIPIKVFLMTENSDTYEHKTEGAIRDVAYTGFATHEVDISNEDFVKDNGIFYKVVDLKKVLHPVSTEIIGLSFALQKINITDDDDEEDDEDEDEDGEDE